MKHHGEDPRWALARLEQYTDVDEDRGWTDTVEISDDHDGDLAQCLASAIMKLHDNNSAKAILFAAELIIAMDDREDSPTRKEWEPLVNAAHLTRNKKEYP